MLRSLMGTIADFITVSLAFSAFYEFLKTVL